MPSLKRVRDTADNLSEAPPSPVVPLAMGSVVVCVAFQPLGVPNNRWLVKMIHIRLVCYDATALFNTLSNLKSMTAQG